MKYRKKPVIIDAVQWDGNNYDEIHKFCSSAFLEVVQYIDETKVEHLIVLTLEGNMEAKFGDYIIRGVNGEFYPCKPDIFKKTYEALSNTEFINLRKERFNKTYEAVTDNAGT
jgi:hypothetical protein